MNSDSNPYSPPASDTTSESASTPSWFLTKAAWWQGAKNGLMCTIVSAIVWFTMHSLISYFTGWSDFICNLYAFVALMILSFVTMLVGGIRARYQRGEFLQDFGGNPGKWAFYLNAVIFLILGTVQLIDTPAFGKAGFVFQFVMVSFFLFMGFTRLLIYENGIWAYTSLIRWEKIKTYSWQNGNTFMFETSRRFPTLARGAIPIPMHRLEEFKELLEQHLPLDPQGQRLPEQLTASPENA